MVSTPFYLIWCLSVGGAMGHHTEFEKKRMYQILICGAGGCTSYFFNYKKNFYFDLLSKFAQYGKWKNKKVNLFIQNSTKDFLRLFLIWNTSRHLCTARKWFKGKGMYYRNRKNKIQNKCKTFKHLNILFK